MSGLAAPLLLWAVPSYVSDEPDLGDRAATVLAPGLLSGFIKNRFWISEPLIATVIGIIVGPAVISAAAFTLPEKQETTVLLEFSRVTLAISIMSAALRLPSRWRPRTGAS